MARFKDRSLENAGVHMMGKGARAARRLAWREEVNLWTRTQQPRRRHGQEHPGPQRMMEMEKGPFPGLAIRRPLMLSAGAMAA